MTRSEPRLNLSDGLVLLGTSLLGSSVFVVPVLGVKIAGQSSLVSWLILIAFMVPMAIVFGELGRTYPHAGGVSHWAGRAFGRRIEWVSALLLVTVIPVGLPAALLLAMIFINHMLPFEGHASLLVQFAILAAVYALNRAGLKASAGVQTLIISGTVIFIIALAWAAPLTLPSLTPVVSFNEVPAVMSAAGLMLWCFLGLEIVANLAEDFKNPERDIPLSVIGGILLAGIVYYLCAATVIAAGFSTVTENALLLLASERFGSAGVMLLAVFGFLACFASLNTYTSGFSRGLWSLADEGKLPAFLTSRSTRQVPVASLNLITLVCAVSVLVFHFGWLDLSQLIFLANAHFVGVYLIAMLSAAKLLTGYKRAIAIVGASACLIGFISLGLATLYGAAVALILYVISHHVDKTKHRPGR